MCLFGGGNSAPATPPPPAPVDNTNINQPAAQTSVASQKAKAALAQGINSTVVTSPLGTANPTTQQATLSGGA